MVGELRAVVERDRLAELRRQRPQNGSDGFGDRCGCPRRPPHRAAAWSGARAASAPSARSCRTSPRDVADRRHFPRRKRLRHEWNRKSRDAFLPRSLISRPATASGDQPSCRLSAHRLPPVSSRHSLLVGIYRGRPSELPSNRRWRAIQIAAICRISALRRRAIAQRSSPKLRIAFSSHLSPVLREPRPRVCKAPSFQRRLESRARRNESRGLALLPSRLQQPPQVVLRLQDVRPHVPRLRQPPVHRVDVEIAWIHLTQFVPPKRHGHRRAR